MARHYSTSGTGGDAWITLCKLLTLDTPITLHHYRNVNERERWVRLVSDIFRLAPVLQDIIFVRERCESHPRIYSETTLEDDPPELDIDFFPELGLKAPPSLREDSEYSVLVCNSGKRPGNGRNTKILSKGEVRERVSKDPLLTVLLGTNEYHRNLSIDGARNKVCRTGLIDAINIVHGASYVRGPEGLLTYVSMSQRVPTSLDFTDTDIVSKRIKGTPWDQYLLSSRFRTAGKGWILQ